LKTKDTFLPYTKQRHAVLALSQGNSLAHATWTCHATVWMTACKAYTFYLLLYSPSSLPVWCKWTQSACQYQMLTLPTPVRTEWLGCSVMQEICWYRKCNNLTEMQRGLI